MTARLTRAAAASCLTGPGIARLIDAAGAGATIVVYEGEQPESADDELPTGLNEEGDPDPEADSVTELVSFTLPNPCFADPAAANRASRVTANPIDPATVVADGTASFFRVYDAEGAAVYDGSVSLQGGTGDLQLSDLNLVSGIQVQVFSYTIEMPTGA